MTRQLSTSYVMSLAILVFGSGAYAQDGLALMKVEPGARPSGMGSAFVSLTGDPNVSAYNPAGATGGSKFSAAFSHSTYWENIRLENGFFTSPLKGRLFIHGGIRYATIDNLEMRQSPVDIPDALFEANDVSFKAGLAYRFSEKVSAGIGAGWFIEKIESWRGSAFNVDFGIQAVPRPDVRLGAAVTDLGSDFNLTKSGAVSSRDISLPTAYRFGGSYTYRKYLGAADIVVLDDKAHLHLGAESRLHELFQLRAGFMSGYDSKNFTAGASFTRSSLRVDYAFVPYTHSLGTSHIFSFVFEI
ncbi:MAG: PorV/PorQ family protein [Candidatus Zixiibacteriota bacterium]